MSLPKNYRPDEREAAIYQRWEKSGYFNPDNLPLPEEAPSYTIILPPPNITDKLHLGHAAMLAIEDVLIRFARMRLRRALWLPGTDHAAIATQNAVEKKLWREKKLTRHDLGREKFLQEVWRFLRSTQSTIQRQMRVMGASLDWSREAFTLDPPRQKAVTEMFVRMYRDGVIYRGQRVVNWCPRCKSTLADDEIEYRPQKGHLYTFRYWKDFPFAISSTRPETKLGDTAVAVNPADERYRPFIGQTFEGDFCGVKLKIKVIADRHVDSSFGTGALGVTPAHSLADEQIARRHDLPSVQVIDQEARIRPGFGRFSSLSVLEARENIAERLREEGLLEKEEEIENNLSVCYRCDTAIEPLPSEQWFVAVDRKLSRLGGKSLKERALECADAGEIEFIPARFAKRYRDWMENLHDWCISRQIWFGHRIPVWYCDCGEVVVDTEEPETCPRCGGDKLTRDPDVLDTWFSSGMWTFSTLGWPDNFRHGRKTGDLARFHPTEVLETGYEIITLWVSRMIMMSLFALGEIPFRKVHLHGMILDQNGKKMSKSKGNGIDPIEVVEKFGTDAVRLSLLIGNTPGNDMRLSEEKIKSYRNFVTKLWNIARYCDFAVKDRKLFSAVDRVPAAAGDADRWILSRLRAVARDVSRNIERHNLSTAGEKLRDFTWGDFADWYLETHKAERNDAVLVFVLRQLLLLWHPFTPFVTEEINSRLFAAEADDNRQLLMIAPWPDLGSPNAADEENFSLLRELIVKIRDLRAAADVPAGEKVDVFISTDRQSIIERNRPVLERLARTGKIDFRPTGAGAAVFAGGTVALALDKSLSAAKRARRRRELEKLRAYAETLHRRLADENFRAKAPAAIVRENEKKLAEAEDRLEKLRQSLGEE